MLSSFLRYVRSAPQGTSSWQTSLRCLFDAPLTKADGDKFLDISCAIFHFLQQKICVDHEERVDQ